MTVIALEGLTKRYGATPAIEGLDLTIPAGELFFVLGPSGCGKTTLLRLIAGFLEPGSGRIRFDGRDVTGLPPNRRRAAMVFQSYALWPHMSVFENVAHGLRVQRVPRAARVARVEAALRLVRLENLAERRPGELSGGEQQRVALARALVVQPEVLLLDEPLSNLDARLRVQVRHEIRRICRDTGITTVYVTHDQADALCLADTIAVLRQGRLEQVGAPRELYQRPRSRFVAGFLGQTNLLPARVVDRDPGGAVTIETEVGRLTGRAGPGRAVAGAPVTCSVRPEAFSMTAPGAPCPSGANRLRGRRTATVYLGHIAEHIVELTGGFSVRTIELNPAGEPSGADEVQLFVSQEDVVLLDD